MIDLLLRHGVFAKTHYHIEEAVKLKLYFDDLLGYNLYDLFPEIKENLYLVGPRVYRVVILQKNQKVSTATVETFLNNIKAYAKYFQKL